MGNSSSFCPDVGLLRCDCGYEHGHVDGGSSKPAPSKLIPRLPPPRYGNLITMLSIDGGGIRGLIPAVVLGRLEEELQAIDGKDAQIADYFDVMAGTSTGALIVTMLALPGNHGRPKYNPKEIEDFYIKNGPSIFPPKNYFLRQMGLAGEIIHALKGPKYDGVFLHQKIEEFTEKHTLANALSRLVVPTFDVYRLAPIIFSSFEDHLTDPQKRKKETKSLLSDVCIGTSAAPTYFPTHYFYNDRPNGKRRSNFHLADGAVAANNPTMAAIMRVTREVLLRNPDFHHSDVNYNNFLVISIGTGSFPEEKGAYTAADCAKWGAFGWLFNLSNKHSPLIDMYSHASSESVDLQVRMLLNHDQAAKYLRIQAQVPGVLPMDNATKKNTDSLVDIAQKLLKSNSGKVDLYLGTYQTSKNGPTNDKELERFAKLLVAERKLRLERQKEEGEEKMATSEAAPTTSVSPDGFKETSIGSPVGATQEGT